MILNTPVFWSSANNTGMYTRRFGVRERLIEIKRKRREILIYDIRDRSLCRPLELPSLHC